jgi:hypothetical protein
MPGVPIRLWMSDAGGRRHSTIRPHRHDVGLLTDPDDHSVHDRKRQRQRQLNCHAAPAIRLQRNTAADILDVAPNDIHSDAASGNVRDLLGSGKSRQKNQIVDLFLV